MIIPDEVWQDKELKPNARLLYGSILRKSQNAPCWARNAVFADELHMDERAVQRLIADLKQRGYIAVILQGPGNKERLITPNIYPTEQEGLRPNCHPDQKVTVTELSPDYDQKVTYKKEKKRQRYIRSNADFDLFWTAYPKKKAKQDARKAFEKVDVPLAVLLDALSEHKKSGEWRKDGGKYIPYPATWLNGQRWEDELTSEIKEEINYEPLH